MQANAYTARVYKKPSPSKIFIKNPFFNLFKLKFMYSLLKSLTSFLVIKKKYIKFWTFYSCLSKEHAFCFFSRE